MLRICNVGKVLGSKGAAWYDDIATSRIIQGDVIPECDLSIGIDRDCLHAKFKASCMSLDCFWLSVFKLA